MRSTIFTMWIFAAAVQAGQQHEITPAELQASMEAGLRGRAELIYGSSAAAPWNAAPAGTGAASMRQAIVSTPQLPSAPAPVLNLGTVSARELRHAVPKEARKAYDRGLKLSAAGDFPGAARELEQAVVRDPEYAAAQGDLGVTYLRMERLAEAEPHLRRAAELDPSSSAGQSNLAAEQFLLGDPEAAERSVRRALELSSANDHARYLLGLLLARDTRTLAEARMQLEYAARTIPAAKTVLQALRGTP
jgi:Flp pilus assembly protein TadD